MKCVDEVCDLDIDHKHDHGKNDDHNHSHEFTKVNGILFFISIFILVLGFIPIFSKYQMIFAGISILLAGYDLLIDGLKNIIKFNLEEEALMTIAVIAAFILGEYFEAAFVVILFKIGAFLETRSVANSKKSIEDIVKIIPENANLLINEIDNEFKVVESKTLKIGDSILIKPGEKVPVDVTVIKGESEIDTSAITGESKYSFVSKDLKVISGSINVSSVIICRVDEILEKSTATQIINLVNDASKEKGKTEKFITKFSKIYTPVVIVLAIIVAIVPPIILKQSFNDWIMRALVFLVASCPCALVISVPLSFYATVGKIAKTGLLLKGTKYVENMSKITAVAFDKTGTITTGNMEIELIETFNNFSKEKFITYMYSLEKNSNHPISTAISKYKKDVDTLEVKNYKDVPGKGISGEIEGNEIIIGNVKIMQDNEITGSFEEEYVYMSVNNKLVGYIELKEEIHVDNIDIEKEFRNVNINNVVMLTGDNEKAARLIAKKAGIKNVYASLLPKDKLEKVKNLKTRGEKVLFVGDGINDAPVIAAADFSISIAEGSDIANSLSDAVLISKNLKTIPKAISLAKKGLRISKFNIAFSIIIKVIVLILGILGIAPIWLAILADTGVTVLTVLNAMR